MYLTNLPKIHKFRQIMKYSLSILIFFLGTVLLFSQDTAAQKELLKRTYEKYGLLKTNPEQAFAEAKKIEKEARNINAKEAELRALVIIYVYYRNKNDFESMLTVSNSLFQKAEKYKIPVYQAIAKTMFFESYFYSDLPERAFRELGQGMELIEKSDDKDSITIRTKADLFTHYANYYSLKNDYENQLKYLNLAGGELEKYPVKKYRKRFLYLHYSNIANLYIEMNMPDSAKYYVLLSQLKGEDYTRVTAELNNLQVLGEVAMKEKDYEKALDYFKKAEKLYEGKPHQNIEILFENIIESYTELHLKDSVRLYKAKMDSLKLSISENQNKSLHKLLSETNKTNYKIYIYLFGSLLAGMSVALFFIIRKNRILSRQEKISQEYLLKSSGNQNSEAYSKLIEMFKNNDLAFMTYFEEVFPDFTAKVSKLSPGVIQSEMEFYALLKLKISTNDIALYRYIEPKTVRNKKYLIKKKFNIPKEADIYQWFSEL